MVYYYDWKGYFNVSCLYKVTSDALWVSCCMYIVGILLQPIMDRSYIPGQIYREMYENDPLYYRLSYFYPGVDLGGGCRRCMPPWVEAFFFVFTFNIFLSHQSVTVCYSLVVNPLLRKMLDPLLGPLV